MAVDILVNIVWVCLVLPSTSADVKIWDKDGRQHTKNCFMGFQVGELEIFATTLACFSQLVTCHSSRHWSNLFRCRLKTSSAIYLASRAGRRVSTCFFH